MSFRFALESLLRLRRSQMRAEQLRLAAIHAELARRRQWLDDVGRQLRSDGGWAERDEASAFGAELHFLQYRREHLLALRAEMMRTMAEWEAKRAEQQLRLQAAHQAMEVLASLRQEQALRFAAEAARQEQRRTDDQTLQRRWRGRQVNS
jgi:flagellar export protein FliJ